MTDYFEMQKQQEEQKAREIVKSRIDSISRGLDNVPCQIALNVSNVLLKSTQRQLHESMCNAVDQYQYCTPFDQATVLDTINRALEIKEAPAEVDADQVKDKPADW